MNQTLKHLSFSFKWFMGKERVSPPSSQFRDSSNEVVDGALQGRLDEVVLQSSRSVLLQRLVGNVVSISIDQAPLGSDEVLVVLSLVSSQEPGSLLLHVLGLSVVEVSLNFEDSIQEGVHSLLGDLVGCHLLSLLLELIQVDGVLSQDSLSSVEAFLDGGGMAKANLVVGLLEGDVELVLADDAEGSDGGLQGGVATVGVLEDNVGGNLVTQDVDGGKLSDNPDHLPVLTSLEEGQALSDQSVDEVEAFDVLDNGELLTNHSEGLQGVFLLGAEGPGNGGAISQEAGNLLHSVVQVGELQGLFNGGGLLDVVSNVGPGSSSDVSHFKFLLKIVSW